MEYAIWIIESTVTKESSDCTRFRFLSAELLWMVQVLLLRSECLDSAGYQLP